MKIINEIKYLTYNIYEYNEVDTTMNAVKAFSENSIVITQKQTNGRGKGNRVWNSDNNGNLYFSILLKASNKNLDYSQLSFLSSVAMRYAIQKFNKDKNNSIVSKWPNDILLNEKKICGMLLELDLSSKNLVIGIGVNINSYPDTVLFSATSLLKYNIIVERYELLKEFLDSFNNLFNEWQNYGFKTIRNRWLESCYKLNDMIVVNGVDGIFKNIDNDGTLILQKSNGELMFIKSGDVF